MAAATQGIESQGGGRVETMKINGLEMCRQVTKSVLLHRSNNQPTSQQLVPKLHFIRLV